MSAPQHSITIRSAGSKDSGSIHAMILALAKEINVEMQVVSQPSDFSQLGSSESPCFDALIAENDDEAVGLCLYFFSFSSWLGRRGVYVQDLYVVPSQRATGLGRRLLAETARIASKQGASYLRLSVDGANVVAQSFYKSMGMQYSEHEMIFKAMGDDFEALYR